MLGDKWSETEIIEGQMSQNKEKEARSLAAIGPTLRVQSQRRAVKQGAVRRGAVRRGAVKQYWIEDPEVDSCQRSVKGMMVRNLGRWWWRTT